MNNFLTAAATAIIGVWLFILMIQLFIQPTPQPFFPITSCCWVWDQFHRQHYIGPWDERTIMGIPIREEK